VNIYDKVSRVPFRAMINAPITLLLVSKIFDLTKDIVKSYFLGPHGVSGENTANSNNQVDKSIPSATDVKAAASSLPDRSEGLVSSAIQECSAPNTLVGELADE